MRILYLSNIPAPYTVERLNVMAGVADVELVAGFLEERTQDRSWGVDPAGWAFPASYVGMGSSGILSTVRLVRAVRPDILVSLYERPEFLAGIAAARALGAPPVLHAMKTFESWAERRRHRELAKKLLFPRVDFHVTGPDSSSYVAGYGARPDRVHVIPEPVDVARFRNGSDEARAKGRRLANGTVFLYVGRLWRGKGLDYLLDAFEQLRLEGLDVSLVLAGDGVDESVYRERARRMDRVVFTGFVDGDDLPALYGSADVFVFPTLGDPYGEVIQESMASGLPVISSTAAGDIADRVHDGNTGFLVPPANVTALADAMRSLALDPSRRRQFGDAGKAHISTRTVGWWSGELHAALRTVLGRR